MLPSRPDPWDGIYAATIAPLREDLALDEAALARHFADMAAVDGIVGVLCNGHAGENFALGRDEKRRVVEIARSTIGNRSIVVCGINAESSLEAAAHAADAAAAGADAIMVFPPYSWALGHDREMAVTHHRMIGETAGLPMMLFFAAVGAGQMAYRPETIADLVRLPGVVAIKEGSWETARYEANRRLVTEVAPAVRVMASGDEHLFTSYVVGSEGSLVSLAVLLPEAIVALDRAVKGGDLAGARAQHARIHPLARAIYGVPPGNHATARLKTCLKLLGKLPCDRVRPPIGPLPPDEVSMLRRALGAAGLL